MLFVKEEIKTLKARKREKDDVSNKRLDDLICVMKNHKKQKQIVIDKFRQDKAEYLEAWLEATENLEATDLLSQPKTD